MAEDVVKPAGATKASQNDAGGGVIRSEPVIGIVKNNIDPIRTGRIQVYIQDKNGYNPDDASNWITVRYLSPFYGRTPGQSESTGYGEYPNNPISYGEWHSPPDIGTQVICIFVNGDMNYGYYIGCIPEPEALTMVPAIGSVKTKVILNEGEAKSLAGATQLPVTNMNTANEGLSNNGNFLEAPKPVHSYLSSTLAQQGLIRDTIRGTITTSSQRETPSRVGWGVSTPGRPIYEGGATDQTVVKDVTEGGAEKLKIISRRAGHSFIMDDGDIAGADQLIRLRTSLGHQILMSDDGQCLFIIHANGQSWVELGKEGTIDMYATNSVNVRTQGDLNLHADNNVNIQADKNINIKAKENLTINTDKDFVTRVGANFKQQTLGNHALKTNGKLALVGDGEASLASGAVTYINGGPINLNTGSASLSPAEVKMMQMFAQTDTLFDQEKGFIPTPGKLQTIASRAPAHHPWINANQGVNVKTKVNADEELPASASKPVETANSEAPATPKNPTSEPVVSTVPNEKPASENLSVGTTSSLVSSQAVTAAINTPGAVNVGTAIAEGQAKVGALAQSAQQMVTGGTLKPGADRLINGLVQQGASVSGAMTQNMFTGANGAKDLTSFVKNTGAQVSNMVSAISTTEKQLINTGLISGNQSPTQTGGMIMSGLQNGVGKTVDFVKNIAGNIGSVASGLGAKLGGVDGKIPESISSGNFATKLAASGPLTDAPQSIKDAIEKAKGPVTAAFNSIKEAYKNFKPNIPQDLTSLAKSNTAETTAGKEVEESVNPYAGLTPEQIELLGDADPTDPYIRLRLGIPVTGMSNTPPTAGEINAKLNSAGLGEFSGLTTSALGAGNQLKGSLTSGLSLPSVGSLSSLTGKVPGIDTGGFSMPSMPSLGGITSAGKSLISNPIASATAGVKNLNIAKTGLQGIPGGQNALSLVVNNASSALPSIPGAGSLNSLINTNSSAALNGVSGSLMSSASKLEGSLGPIADKFGAQFASGKPINSQEFIASAEQIGEQLKQEGSSLVPAVTSVLPKGLGNELNSAVKAIATSNPDKIKVPIVAENTVQRDSVDTQVTTIISNPKVPPPDYGGDTQQEIKTQQDDLYTYKQKLKEQQARFDAQLAIAKKAKQEYQNAANELPAGDPKVVELKEKFQAEYKKALEISVELEELMKSNS